MTARWRSVGRWGLAGLAGGAMALAFPPFDLSPLAWVALVPLLWLVTSSSGYREAVVAGWVAGFVFFLVVLDPLVSAHLWSGWSASGEHGLVSAVERQRLALEGLRGIVALWSGATWGLFAAGLRWFSLGRPVAVALAAPSLWVLSEQIRVRSAWSLEWGALGHALAGSDVLRQGAWLGGVWLLSAVVVLGNTAIFLAIFSREDGTSRRVVLVIAALFGVLALWGAWRLQREEVPPGGSTVRVGALQFHEPRYTASDFLPTGMEKAYLQLIPQALQIRPDLLVLPESISARAIKIDHEPSIGTSKPVVPIESWERPLRSLLEGTETTVLLGVDTLDAGATYNSMVAWTARGLAGVYDKRRPVPFAEYRPGVWRRFLSGRYDYASGVRRGPIQLGDLRLGVFICQEVQFSGLIRDLVREGAVLLASGGNDGVFADPAVAETHADMAQIRAVESGRYLVRAMKSGVSAIVDPLGREIERSPGSDPVYLWADVAPRDERTPFVLLGPWPVLLACVVALVLAAGLGRERASARERANR